MIRRTILCRIALPCGAFTLQWRKEEALLYITSEKGCTAAQSTELCGYGSGDFPSGTEATDVMSDTTAQGRWLSFDLSGSGDKMVILEPDRKGPAHLKDAEFANQAFGQALVSDFQCHGH